MMGYPFSSHHHGCIIMQTLVSTITNLTSLQELKAHWPKQWLQLIMCKLTCLYISLKINEANRTTWLRGAFSDSQWFKECFIFYLSIPDCFRCSNIERNRVTSFVFLLLFGLKSQRRAMRSHSWPGVSSSRSSMKAFSAALRKKKALYEYLVPSIAPSSYSWPVLRDSYPLIRWITGLKLHSLCCPGLGLGAPSKVYLNEDHSNFATFALFS